MPKKTKTKKASKLPPMVRYELWLSPDRAVIGFSYPPEDRGPNDYEDYPGDYIQIAPRAWAILGGPSEIDGKIRPYQWDVL